MRGTFRLEEVKTRKRGIIHALLWLSVLSLTLALSLPAHALLSGMTGSYGGPSGKHCMDCHKMGTAPTMLISGPTTVAPGSANTFLVTVIPPDPPALNNVKVGLNAAVVNASKVNQGTMGAGSNTRLVMGQITHQGGALLVNGAPGTFDFTWTAPATPGTYNLYTCVCSVDGSGGSAGDNGACGQLAITVSSETTTEKLWGISSRAKVLTGEDVVIGGFIVDGGGRTVLIRGRGPSLGDPPFNLPTPLADPTLVVYSGATPIAQNDNWQSTDPLCGAPATWCGNDTDISATGYDPCQPNPGQSGPPAGCANESAVLIELPPGAYTAVVSGVGGETGSGIVEVFDLTPGN